MNTATARKHKKAQSPAPVIIRKVDPVLLAYILTVTYLILAGLVLLNHEMWRDEHQAWLVARDASSFTSLLHNMRYEGNPALWHSLLFIITRFTHDPVWMQVLHIMLAAGGVFMIARYAKFSVWAKIAVIFGYFFFYEYAIISRSYVLGLLLLISICVLYGNRAKYYMLLGLLLGLLGNVTVYMLMISSCLAFVLFLDFVRSGEKNRKMLTQFASGGILFVLLALFSVYQIIPEPDNSFPTPYADEAFNARRWSYIFSRFFTTYFYLPDWNTTSFWNSNAYFSDDVVFDNPSLWAWFGDHKRYLWTWIILPAASLLTGILFFLRKPLVLIFYLGTTIGLLALNYYTGMVHYRYCGHLLLSFFAAIWLSGYMNPIDLKNNWLSGAAAIGQKLGKLMIILVLTFQLISSFIAVFKETSNKFSNAEAAAKFVKDQGLERLPMTGYTDFIVSPLASYLDSRLYYPQMNAFGSFTVWNKNRKDSIGFASQFSIADSLLNKNAAMLIIKSSPYQVTMDNINFTVLSKGIVDNKFKLDLLASFEDESIVKDEKYYLYRLSRIVPTSDLRDYIPINTK